MSGQILVEVVRSGFVEAWHRGSVVALTADGSVDWAVGDIAVPIFSRSSNKPIQALGMLRAGLDLDGKLLAVTVASHSGEPFHLDAVREILRGAGLNESDLQTPPDFPLSDEAREAFIRSGASRSSIAMNCSGKHAAMLATCMVNGWPTTTYLDASHPLQRALASTLAEATGEAITAFGVDGCGAPVFSASLVGLARAFRSLVVADPGSYERRIADAIAGYPEYVSGTTRDEARLLRAVPGAIAKAGAEGCYALALPDGRAVALKIDDGGVRARPVVMAAALERLGLDSIRAADGSGIDAQAVLATGRSPLLGGSTEVGELRTTPALCSAAPGDA
jgi:L-asparaginase II